MLQFSDEGREQFAIEQYTFLSADNLVKQPLDIRIQMGTTHRIQMMLQGMFSFVPSTKYFRTSLWKLSILFHPVDFQSLLKFASNFPYFSIFHILRLSSFLKWLTIDLPTTTEPFPTFSLFSKTTANFPNIFKFSDYQLRELGATFSFLGIFT